MKDHCLVTVGGSVSTGSTPVLELLKEYEGMKVVCGEFRPGKYIYELIADLYLGKQIGAQKLKLYEKYTLNYGDDPSFLLSVYHRGLIRLPRPIAEFFNVHVDEITHLVGQNRQYERMIPGFKQAVRKLFRCLEELDLQMDELQAAERKKRLFDYCEVYFRTISGLFVSDNPREIPVIDQMINPKKLFSAPGNLILARLLPFVRMIVVTRDARDQYCDIVRKQKKKYHLMRSGVRLKSFIREYTQRYEEMDRWLNKLPENVMHVQFEDLVLNYDYTRERIEEFLVLGTQHSPRRYFDPDKAARNVAIYRQFPNQKEMDVIEQNMGQWLYDFASDQNHFKSANRS